jgi:hypothetical protein
MMKYPLLFITIPLFLTACGGESNSNNDSDNLISLELNKADVDYLAYKIAGQNWIEVIEKIDITISGQQTLTFASICIDNNSESYNSQAVVHNIESLTDNNITAYNPKCGFFSDRNVEGTNVTITSQQEEIAIGAVSTPNILNIQSLEQDFRLTVSNEEPFDIAILGISQEKEIYIYKSLHNTTSDVDNIIIDFYNEYSVKVTEFQEIPLNNWDDIEPLYEVDSLLIPLFNHWQSGSENSISKKFISIPEVLKKESGRFYTFLSKNTNINDYFLEARILDLPSSKATVLPDDLSNLENISINNSDSNKLFTLSIQDTISSIIPLPLDRFTIKKSSSHTFDPFNPAPPYWDKKQITTNYIVTKNQSISLAPIEFHLLPNSPISVLSSDELTSISSSIYFLNGQVNNDKLDYYKLSRNLNEFIAN